VTMLFSLLVYGYLFCPMEEASDVYWLVHFSSYSTPCFCAGVCLVQWLVLSHVESSHSPSRQDALSLRSCLSDNDIVIVSLWTKVLFVLCAYHGDITSSFYRMNPATLNASKPFKTELSFHHHHITDIDLTKLSIFHFRLLNTNS